MSARVNRRRVRRTRACVFAIVTATTAIMANVQSSPSPSWGLDAMDGVRDGRYVYPATTTSVRIYVIDTGVLSSHPDFGGRATSLGHFCNAGPDITPWTPTNGVAEVQDDGTRSGDGFGGHGTHNASYAAGAQSGVAKTAL